MESTSTKPTRLFCAVSIRANCFDHTPLGRREDDRWRGYQQFREKLNVTYY